MSILNFFNTLTMGIFSKGNTSSGSSLQVASYLEDIGTLNAYSVSSRVDISGYTEGLRISFQAASTNTGAATLIVNDMGPKTIKKNVSSDLGAGDIASGQVVDVVYDGTNFQLITTAPSGGTGTSGTSGLSGTSGSSGNNGTSGTSATGAAGTSGSSGTSGGVGPSGSSGSSGTSGINGNTGTSGTSGANGTSGTSSNGTSGSSGTSGQNGANGSSGTSGAQGIQGTGGTSGTSGASGSSGTSGTGGGGGVNIYNSNGTLDADRTVDTSTFDLMFKKGASSVLTLTDTERVVIGTPSSVGYGKSEIRGTGGSTWRGTPVGLHLRQATSGAYWTLWTNDAADTANPSDNIGTITYLGEDGDFWIESKRTLSGNFHTVEIGLDPSSDAITISAGSNSQVGAIALWPGKIANTGSILFGVSYGSSRNDGASTTNRFLSTNSAGDMKMLSVVGTAPAGGSAGQVLTKLSGSDYDYTWQAGGGGGSQSLQQTTDIGNVTNDNIDLTIDDPLTGILADSPFLKLKAKGNNGGTVNTVNFQQYVDITALTGTATYRLQRQLNAGSIVNVLSIGTNGSVAFQNATATQGYSFAFNTGAQATGTGAVVLSQNAIGAGTTCFIAGGQNYEIASTTIGATSLGTDGYTFDGGNYSFVCGDANVTFGYSSITGGFGNVNYGNYGFVMGNDNVLGNTSNTWDSTKKNLYQSGVVFGTQNRSYTGNHHFVFGRAVDVHGGDSIIAFGSGIDATNTRMTATEAKTFNVGFNSTIPTFIVHGASGASTAGITEAAGDVKINTVTTISNDNALTDVLVRAADGTIKSRSASTLGGGSSSSETITKTSHGFTVGMAVQKDEFGVWRRCQAIYSSNLSYADGYVCEVVDVNNFKIVQKGARINATGLGLSANTIYYLATTGSGVNYTTNLPLVGEIYKEVFRTNIANEATIIDGPSMVVSV